MIKNVLNIVYNQMVCFLELGLLISIKHIIARMQACRRRSRGISLSQA